MRFVIGAELLFKKLDNPPKGQQGSAGVQPEMVAALG
jgi:hypothetical protein